MSSLDLVPYQFRDGAMRAALALRDLDRVLIAAHANLDGDAFGSICACGHLLASLGHKFALYSSTGVPDNIDFLPLPGKVHSSLATLPFEPLAALYLDCGEPMRLGSELGAIYDRWPSVNIDHHLGGDGMGTIANYVMPDAAATAQLVAYVAEALKEPPRGAMADCVALGLITDTGGFCNGNTSAEVFELCAFLTRHGCKITDIREKLQHNWTLGRIRLWGEAFGNVRLVDSHKIAICCISLEDLGKYHCSVEDLEGLVEWLRKIRGVMVGALLREEPDNVCKFSLRSRGDLDVRAIAASLGGGGHRNAAGGTISGGLGQASGMLLDAIKRGLN